jgi:hypothetical protein
VRVGKENQPLVHQSESPLLRVLVEEEYRLLVRGSQLAYLQEQPDGRVPAASVWVHRFYDRSASTFGQHPEEYVLERAAEDLFELVQLVLRKTGGPGSTSSPTRWAG